MKALDPLVGAAIGFAALAAYVVIPEGNQRGWSHDVAGYLIGTGIGAGIFGALLGWAICYLWRRFQMAKSN